MANEELKRIKDVLDKKLQEKKDAESKQEQLGWFSILLDSAVDRFTEVLSKLQIKAPEVTIHTPEVKVPDIHIPAFPEIKIPDIHVPEIKLPTIVIPEIKIPDIIVPKAEVEVRIPEIKIPTPEVTVNVPKIEIPKLEWPGEEMPIRGWVQLMGVGMDNPLPVQLRDKDGKPVNLLEGLSQITSGGGARIVKISEILSTIDTRQVSGSSWSVTVNGFGASVGATILNGEGNSLDPRDRNWTITETVPVSVASTLDVRQVSGANWSVSSIPLGNSFFNVTSATSSTVVKSSSGVLHTITINKRGTGSVCDVYGDLVGEGSKIASIDTTLSTTAFLYDIAFTSGLVIVTTGAAGADLTVSYT